MRAALATTVLAMAIAMGTTVPAMAARPPSRHQIASAVRSAERSRSLWATVNICNSRRYPYRIGVRGQMPSLGFPSVMAMTVTLNSWSATDKRFVAIKSPNAVDRIVLGSHRTGLEQDGTIFPFDKQATGRWNATIEFTWTVHGRIVGRAKRRTTAGHRDADFANPPHYSAAQCRIG